MKNVDKASVVRMVLAVLAAIKLVLQPFGIDVGQDLIDAVADGVGAVIVVYAAWRNNYVSKKGQAQAAALKDANLK